ncbi:hypothetical protein D3C85_1171420 [compost metagenome]
MRMVVSAVALVMVEDLVVALAQDLALVSVASVVQDSGSEDNQYRELFPSGEEFLLLEQRPHQSAAP